MNLELGGEQVGLLQDFKRGLEQDLDPTLRVDIEEIVDRALAVLLCSLTPDRLTRLLEDAPDAFLTDELSIARNALLRLRLLALRRYGRQKKARAQILDDRVIAPTGRRFFKRSVAGRIYFFLRWHREYISDTPLTFSAILRGSGTRDHVDFVVQALQKLEEEELIECLPAPGRKGVRAYRAKW